MAARAPNSSDTPAVQLLYSFDTLQDAFGVVRSMLASLCACAPTHVGALFQPESLQHQASLPHQFNYRLLHSQSTVLLVQLSSAALLVHNSAGRAAPVTFVFSCNFARKPAHRYSVSCKSCCVRSSSCKTSSLSHIGPVC